MRTAMFIGSVFLLSIVLAACGATSPASAPQSNPALEIELSTQPDPPRMDDVELLVTLTQDGQPLAGAEVEVMMDHSDMTGMTMSGTASEQGNGRYALVANFSMSGSWKGVVIARANGEEVTRDFRLVIQP